MKALIFTWKILWQRGYVRESLTLSHYPPLTPTWGLATGEDMCGLGIGLYAAENDIQLDWHTPFRQQANYVHVS